MRVLGHASIQYCDSDDPSSFNHCSRENGSSSVARVPFPRCPSQGYINSSDNVYLLNLWLYTLPYCRPACSDSAMSSGRSLSLLVATIFLIIPPLLNGAILEKRPYVLLENPLHPDNPGFPGPPQVPVGATAVAPAATATPYTPTIPVELAMPITSIALPEITAPPLSGSTDCTTLSQCRLYYQVSSAPVKSYPAVLIDYSS